MENNAFKPGQGSWRATGNRPRPQTAQPVQPRVDPVLRGAPPLPPASDKREQFRVARTPQPAASPRLQDLAPPERIQPIQKPAPTLNTSQKLKQKLRDQQDKKRTQKAEKPSPAQPVQNGPATNVTINISMPKLRKPDLPYKRIGKYLAIAAVLVVASIVIRLIIVQVIEQKRINDAKNRLDMVQPQNIKTTPSFKPLVPKSNAAVAQTAGFDGQKDSYSYNDKIKGAVVVVSQQPLKAGGVAPADAVAKIAKNLGATTPLSVATGSAYLAKNAKTGGQMVVLGTDTTLLFVQSPIAHPTADWQTYLDSLQTT